jgi:hypothetical protein
MTLLSRFGEGASGSSTLPAFNWASRPSPADYSGRLIIITDVGVNGSLYFSDGTRWIHESPIVLQQAAKGWLVPSLAAANAATYVQTGTTITVTSAGHNIPATAHDGKDVYLAIASGDAVAGWFDNFTRVDANTFTCESSVSQMTSGTVNTNTAETTVSELTKNIFGGLLGAKGSAVITPQYTTLNSANGKTLRWKFDGVTVLTSSALGSAIDVSVTKGIRNMNSESKQISRASTISDLLGSSSSPAVYSTVNTANDVSSTVTLQLTVASEFIALESFILLVNPS